MKFFNPFIEMMLIFLVKSPQNWLKLSVLSQILLFNNAEMNSVITNKVATILSNPLVQSSDFLTVSSHIFDISYYFVTLA